jgi:hypothetical protein
MNSADTIMQCGKQNGYPLSGVFNFPPGHKHKTGFVGIRLISKIQSGRPSIHDSTGRNYAASIIVCQGRRIIKKRLLRLMGNESNLLLRAELRQKKLDIVDNYG